MQRDGGDVRRISRPFIPSDGIRPSFRVPQRQTFMFSRRVGKGWGNGEKWDIPDVPARQFKRRLPPEPDVQGPRISDILNAKVWPLVD